MKRAGSDSATAVWPRALPGALSRWLAREKGARPWPFFLHSLFGLQLSLFFGFVCFTGSVATVSHEIEWLLLPKVRATSSATPASWGSLWEAARAAHPQVAFEGIGRAGSGHEDYLARVVRGSGPDGRAIEVHVDPGRGAVVGHSSGTSFHSLMRGLHYYLLAPTNVPFYAVTALGAVMLASVVTGLLVYRKFWRGFLKMPRQRKDSRVWWGDLHRLLALWSLWFVLLIGVTSVWYLAERAEWLQWEPEPPPLERALTLPERAQPDGADIDRWVMLAERELTGLRVTAIYLPWGSRGTVTVQGQRHAWLVRERGHAVGVDPRDDRIVFVRDVERMAAAERWVHTADPLHFGDFGGLWTKLVWAAFGLALCALALSGAVVFAKRSARAARRLRVATDAVSR